MPKLLFVTPELPYPLKSGGKIKTWNLLEDLAKEWEITLVCPLKGQDAESLQEFRAKSSIKNIIFDEVQVPRNALNLVKSYLKGCLLYTSPSPRDA